MGDTTSRIGNFDDIDRVIRSVFPRFVEAGLPDNESVLRKICDLMELVYSKWVGQQYFLVEDEMDLLDKPRNATSYRSRIRQLVIGKIGLGNIPMQLVPNAGSIILMSDAFKNYFFFPDSEPEWEKSEIARSAAYIFSKDALPKLIRNGDVVVAEDWKQAGDHLYSHRTRVHVGTKAVGDYLSSSFIRYDGQLHQDAARFFGELDGAIVGWEFAHMMDE